MIAFLQGLGIFIVSFVLWLIFTIGCYYFVMTRFLYIRSCYISIEFLSNHGRGYDSAENENMAYCDLFVRIAWVFLVAVVCTFLGCFLALTRLQMVAVILSCTVFGYFFFRIEVSYRMLVGRLSYLNKYKQIAHLIDIDGNEFDYDYSKEKDTSFFVEGKKYLVADFIIFGRMIPVDEYEWR